MTESHTPTPKKIAIWYDEANVGDGDYAEPFRIRAKWGDDLIETRKEVARKIERAYSTHDELVAAMTRVIRHLENEELLKAWSAYGGKS